MEVVVVRDEKVCGVNARWKNGCKEGNGETVRNRGKKNGDWWRCGGKGALTLWLSVISHHQWQQADVASIGSDVDGKEKWKMKLKKGREMK